MWVQKRQAGFARNFSETWGLAKSAMNSDADDGKWLCSHEKTAWTRPQKSSPASSSKT